MTLKYFLAASVILGFSFNLSYAQVIDQSGATNSPDRACPMVSVLIAKTQAAQNELGPYRRMLEQNDAIVEGSPHWLTAMDMSYALHNIQHYETRNRSRYMSRTSDGRRALYRIYASIHEIPEVFSESYRWNPLATHANIGSGLNFLQTQLLHYLRTFCPESVDAILD